MYKFVAMSFMSTPPVSTLIEVKISYAIEIRFDNTFTVVRVMRDKEIISRVLLIAIRSKHINAAQAVNYMRQRYSLRLMRQHI